MDWATPYTDYTQGQRDWASLTGEVRRQRALDLEYAMTAMEPSLTATRDQRLFANQLEQLRLQDQMARQRAQEQAQLALHQMGLRYILEGAQRGTITGAGVGDALGATGITPGNLYFMDPVTGQPRAYGGATGTPGNSGGYSMGTVTPDNRTPSTVAPPGYGIVPIAPAVPGSGQAAPIAPAVPGSGRAVQIPSAHLPPGSADLVDPSLRYTPRPRSSRGTPNPNAPSITQSILDALGAGAGAAPNYHYAPPATVQPPTAGGRRRYNGATSAQTLFGE